MEKLTSVKGYGDLAKLKRREGREAVVRTTSYIYRVVEAHWVCVGRLVRNKPSYQSVP